jgi:hypothetical protein
MDHNLIHHGDTETRRHGHESEGRTAGTIADTVTPPQTLSFFAPPANGYACFETRSLRRGESGFLVARKNRFPTPLKLHRF